MTKVIQDHLEALYGKRKAREAVPLLDKAMAKHPGFDALPDRSSLLLNQRDVLLIAYGDQVRRKGEDPLKTLGGFMERHLRGVVNGVHLLPFHPYSSDDGYAVMNYEEVDAALGSWEDVHRIGRRFKLMVEGVFNHLSAQSKWFRKFLEGDPEFKDFFIVVRGNPDLSAVARPRVLPLLTPYQTVDGKEIRVWTTFSGDQVDLNLRNPKVMVAVLDALMNYVGHGSEFIRINSTGYLWKQPGTSCLHLPRTHRVVQLMRAVLDEVAPDVMLATGTDMPFEELASYFGDGTNEAQVIYNYTLPPLVLHALARGDAGKLSRWAKGMQLPSKSVTLFNFLASHDGIGVSPARGILSEREIQWLVQRTRDQGGYVAFRQLPGGKQVPSELNINFFDALCDPRNPREGERLRVDRFLCAQAILLAFVGVPGIYFHALFGSRGDRTGVQTSGIPRRINRQKLELAELEKELKDNRSLRARVFGGFKRLLAARKNHRAFHPGGRQEVISGDKRVFGLWRVSPAGRERVLCLHNVTGAKVSWALGKSDLPAGGRVTDLFTGRKWRAATGGGFKIELKSYQVFWAKVEFVK